MTSDKNQHPEPKTPPLNKPKISWTNILSIVTLLIVSFVLYSNLGDIETTLSHLRDTNLLIFFLLIPEQALMLLSGGKIFFSFHSAQTKKSSKPSKPHPPTSAQITTPTPLTISRISLESNFVKQAFPSAGISAATYLAWRLKPYGLSAPETSFLVLLRYFAIVCFNQLQTLLAVFYLLIFRSPTSTGKTVLALALLLVVGTALLLFGAILLVSSRRRSFWFARQLTRLANFLVRTFTFGKKRRALNYEKIEAFLAELVDTYAFARKNLHTLLQPVLWGALYSFLEIATYWVVAISLGHPELLPEIMIGEAIGSIAGAVIPYGPYELGMAGAMASLGTDIGLAGLVVLITRIFFLGENFIFGYICYQHTLTFSKSNPEKQVA